MKKDLIQKKWTEDYRNIKRLTSDELKTILKKGRYPNNNTFPPLHELRPVYRYSDDNIEYLCPRANKTPRKYTIPNKAKYAKLVDSITNCWDSIDILGNFEDPQTIKGLILSNKRIIPISSAILNSELSKLSLTDIYMSSIVKWKNFTQYYLYEDSINYKYLLEMDIKDFYSQIYVHSVPWAITGDKMECKRLFRTDKDMYRRLSSQKIEDSLMGLQDRQTNGIPIGPLGSDIIGELLLCRVVKSVEKKLKGTSYVGIRFKDDFKILCKNREDAEKILGIVADELYNYGLYLNDDKTKISSDFSDLVLKLWYKKMMMLPVINFDLRNQTPSLGELYSLESELFAVMITIKETIKPSDGNFWFEFEKRYSKYLKVISSKYPEGKGRIVIWLIDQLKEYPSHAGAIIGILMSLIPMRDSKYLTLIRERIVKISSQRNYDFCMIWLVYFVAEKYLSSKYDDTIEKVFADIKLDIAKISNEDIRNESERLLDYILVNRDKLSGNNPISKSFKTKWRSFGSDYE